jgi:hypothetical protein
MLQFVATNTAGGMIATSVQNAAPVAPALDCVMLLGFLSAFFTLAIWPYRRRTTQSRIAFCVGLIGLSVYCGLAGAWPAGFIGVAWAITAARESSADNKPAPRAKIYLQRAALFPAEHWNMESRMTRMFGPHRG